MPTLQNVQRENVLAPDELLTHVILPAPGSVKSGHSLARQGRTTGRSTRDQNTTAGDMVKAARSSGVRLCDPGDPGGGGGTAGRHNEQRRLPCRRVSGTRSRARTDTRFRSPDGRKTGDSERGGANV
jgi:hypothetical protein